MKASGLILIIVGIFFGLYVGVWWAFVGGIIDIIESIKAEEIIAFDVAWGVVKIICASFFGWASAVFFLIPGIVLLDK